MPNQYKNKVQYIRNGVPEVLVDLTSDTVTPEALAQGYTAHDASGAPIVGTATGGSMVIRDEQDSHGGTIRHITAGNVVTGTIQITSNGTVDVASYADAEVSVSGGASNVVMGTFTAGTAGTAQTVSINYSGNGYPVSVSIYANDGFGNGSSLVNGAHRYAIICYFAMKAYLDSPNYTGSGTTDLAYGVYQYKSNDISDTINSSSRINGSTIYNSSDATTSAPYFVRITSKNSLSVFVSDTSYGFLSGATYSYVVVYSE